MELLRNKLREQKAVCRAVKEGHWETVRFQKIQAAAGDGDSLAERGKGG